MMKHRLSWLAVPAAALILGPGCDSQRPLPDSPSPGAARDLTENPARAQPKLKALNKKQQKARELADQFDDPREKRRLAPPAP
jgi:hypothetical protein